MPWSAIPKTRRHREDGPPSNLHGTATHARRPAAIPMAQRHPRDTPSSNPHGTAPHAPHARHARRPSSQPATAFHGTAPHARLARRSLPLRSQKRPLQAHIRKSTDSLRLPRFRNAQRAPAHAISRTGPRNPAIIATAHDSLRLPRGSTVQCLPERINASELPRLPRETQVAARKIMRARDTPRTQSPRQSARGTPAAHLPPRTIPAACHAKRTLAMHVQNAPGTQSPRHSAAAHPRHTSQHARNTPDPRSLPRKTMPRSQKCARRRTRTLATRPIPAACHAKRCPGPKNVHGATRGRSQHARSPQPATQNDAQVPKMCTAPHAHARSGATARASLRAGFPHRATVSKTSSGPPGRHNRRI